MNPIIKIKEMTINNIKNIQSGTFQTNTTFENLTSADILGFYGQNGSGKTALVEAFAILELLLNGKSLQKKSRYTIFSQADEAELKVLFYIENESGQYQVEYCVQLGLIEHQLYVKSECMHYCENKPKKRMKELIRYDQTQTMIRKKSISMLKNERQLPFLIAAEWSRKEKVSFIFQEKMLLALESVLELSEYRLITCLFQEYAENLYIIDNQENGSIFGNLIIPINTHYGGRGGKIIINHNGPSVVPEILFDTFEQIMAQTNIVMHKIIPGLVIKVHCLGKETLESGERGVRFELLAQKNLLELPLNCESSGTLKLISIVGTLIAIFNHPSACIVIDELDSGIFEYLLGEILEVLDIDGKGQLIFTSHNLRVLEVLENKKLWFTTLNPMKRFIQLKGIHKNSNIRDIYLRTIQLGGQDESLYLETDSYDIKKAFRKAGEMNG